MTGSDMFVSCLRLAAEQARPQGRLRCAAALLADEHLVAFGKLTADQSQVSLDGPATVGECLIELEAKYPGIGERERNLDGALQRFECCIRRTEA